MAYAASINLASIVLPDKLMRSDTILEGLGELIEDIAQNGLINPISVREIQPGTYRLIAGHRRFLAHRELGKLAIQAMVYSPDEGEDDLIMGSENFQRTQVNPVEEAEFYNSQMVKWGISASEVARRYKRSVTHVLQSVAMLQGDDGVLLALREGRLNKAQALEINKFADEIGKNQAIKYALDNGMTAASIKAWRESRESNGVADTMRQVQPVILENGQVMTLTNLYCQFCKQYHDMSAVQTWQVCVNCQNGLAEALEFWTAHGHNRDETPPE